MNIRKKVHKHTYPFRGVSGTINLLHRPSPSWNAWEDYCFNDTCPDGHSKCICSGTGEIKTVYLLGDKVTKETSWVRNMRALLAEHEHDAFEYTQGSSYYQCTLCDNDYCPSNHGYCCTSEGVGVPGVTCYKYDCPGVIESLNTTQKKTVRQTRNIREVKHRHICKDVYTDYPAWNNPCMLGNCPSGHSYCMAVYNYVARILSKYTSWWEG